MMHRTISIFSLSVFFPCFILGQEFNEIIDSSNVIEEYLTHSEKVSSIRTDFTQEKHTNFLVVPLITEGTFYSEKENKFRWEQMGPSPYVLIINESTAYVLRDGHWKTHDLDRNRQLGYIGELITSIVNGQILRSGEYKMSLSGSDLQYKIELVPKKERMKKYLSKVTILLRKTDWLMDGLTMADASGNKTVIIFHDQASNVALAATLFVPDK